MNKQLSIQESNSELFYISTPNIRLHSYVYKPIHQMNKLVGPREQLFYVSSPNTNLHSYVNRPIYSYSRHLPSVPLSSGLFMSISEITPCVTLKSQPRTKTTKSGYRLIKKLRIHIYLFELEHLISNCVFLRWSRSDIAMRIF